MTKNSPSHIQESELDQINGGAASPGGQTTTGILDLHNEVVSRPKKTQSHGSSSLVCNYFPAGS